MCFFLCNDGSPSRRDATSRWNDSVQLCDACMRRAYSIGTSSHELLLRPASSATRRRAHVPSARARSARAGAERADADVALSAPAHRRLDGERRCDITVLLVIEALLSEQWTTSDVALAPAPSTRNAYDGVGVDSVGPSTSAPRRPAAPERRRRSPRHTPATIVDARTNGVLHVGEATAQPKPQTPAARGDDIARCCSGSVPRPARDSVLTHDIERSGVRVAIAHDRPRRLDADEHHTMPAAPLTALSSRPPGLREGLHVVARSSDAVQPFFAASIKHRAAEFSPCRHGHRGWPQTAARGRRHRSSRLPVRIVSCLSSRAPTQRDTSGMPPWAERARQRRARRRRNWVKRVLTFARLKCAYSIWLHIQSTMEARSTA